MHQTQTEKFIFIGGPADMECRISSGYFYVEMPELIQPMKATEITEIIPPSSFKIHRYELKKINLFGVHKAFYVSQELSDVESQKRIGSLISTLLDIYAEA